MTTRWTDPLPCGAQPAALIAQVADGAGPDAAHQDGCPHCTTTLALLRELWDRVDELARQTVAAPASIDRAVLRRIRRELFVTEALRVFGGIVPRLSRALLTYSGFISQEDGAS